MEYKALKKLNEHMSYRFDRLDERISYGFDAEEMDTELREFKNVRLNPARKYKRIYSLLLFN